MKILMLAPEPFFQPRGTPISVYFRLKALSSLGHQVDLITYHLGEDKIFPGVKIFRIPNLFGIRKIKIGPSFAKIPMDFLMFCRTAAKLAVGRYDLIFSHEEASFFGTMLARLWRIPHIYDMHSCLPQQLENFNFTRSPILKGIFRKLERYVLKHSAAVIVICPDLKKTVENEGWSDKTVLLENFIDFEYPPLNREDILRKRSVYSAEGGKIVLYTGNFQSYQGIPLFLDAAVLVSAKKTKFLLVGDTPEGVEQMRALAESKGIADRVHFTGQVPPEEIPLYLAMADVLVSPRISGTNTPLKIYSFLKSGKPLVATRLWTHTQILDDDTAVLVDPTAENMAKGLETALFDEKAREIAANALRIAEKEYTLENYLRKMNQILELAKKQAK